MIRRIVLLAAASLLVALPSATATAKKKPVNRSMVGPYSDTSFQHPVTITVGKNKQGRRVIKKASFGCQTAGHSPGTVKVKSIKISNAGTFAIEGTRKVTFLDESTAKVELTITGTFKKRSVTGALTPAGEDGPCDAMSYDAMFYGSGVPIFG
ncbi:MAG: hypothetical protein WBC33_04750 [Conexibacter sp.]